MKNILRALPAFLIATSAYAQNAAIPQVFQISIDPPNGACSSFKSAADDGMACKKSIKDWTAEVATRIAGALENHELEEPVGNATSFQTSLPGIIDPVGTMQAMTIKQSCGEITGQDLTAEMLDVLTNADNCLRAVYMIAGLHQSLMPFQFDIEQAGDELARIESLLAVAAPSLQ